MILDFKINKEKVEVISEYSKAILKIRFKVSINEMPFFMDKKMFKTLIKDKDFIDNLKSICYEEFEKNIIEIEKALDMRTEKLEFSDYIDVINRGHGFSLNLVFENSDISQMTDAIDIFRYKAH